MSAAVKSKSFSVTVKATYCKGCEICVQVCPKDIFLINDRQKAVAQHAETCNGCLSCEVYCPDFAITVEEVGSRG